MPAQRIDGKKHRVRGGKVSRHRAVIREVKTHTAKLEASRQAGHPIPKADRVLYWARTQLGKPYCLWGCRCDDCPCRDCSGLIDYALNKANAEIGNPTHICTSSFGFAQMIKNAGLEISREQAIWTPASVSIENPWGDPNWNGSNGHIVMNKGDGEHTVEEGGRATGCYEGRAGRPELTFHGLLLDVDYTKPPPIPMYQQELTMFIQTHHYDMSTAKAIRPTDPPEGQDSVIHVAQDGSAIVCRNDASIFNDQPVDPKRPKAVRRWTSPGNPLPKGVLFIAVSYRAPDAEEPHPGGVALCSDGSQRRFRLS